MAEAVGRSLTHVEFGFEAVLEELGCNLEHRFFLVGFQMDNLVTRPTSGSILEVEGLPIGEMEDMFDAIKAECAPFPDEEDQPTEEWNEALKKHREFTWRLDSDLHHVLRIETIQNGWIPFCSPTYQVGSHFISLGLLVSRQDYEAQPHLDEAISHQEHGVAIVLVCGDRDIPQPIRRGHDEFGTNRSPHATQQRRQRTAPQGRG